MPQSSAPRRLHAYFRFVAVTAVAAVAAAVLLPAAATAFTKRYSAWTSVHHPKRGFAIAYPADVFEPVDGQSEDGRIFASRDGKAKLLIGAFENTSDFTIEAYRDYLLQQSYAGAKVDYERTKAKWFVISGTQGDTMFYERVTFTCGGKLVNSWVMLYPVAERAFYDRIVDAVAPTYLPGAGATGTCQ